MSCLSPINVNNQNVPCGRCVSCLQRLRSDWSIRVQIEAEKADTATFLTLTYEDSNLPYMLVKKKKETKNEDDPRVKEYMELLNSYSLNEGGKAVLLKNMYKYVKPLLKEKNLITYKKKLDKLKNSEISSLKRLMKFQPTLHKTQLQKYFKKIRSVTDKKIKYYAVGEYGTKGKRPHYHAIVLNANPIDLLNKWSKYNRKTKSYEAIGRVRCDKVTPASIHYVTKYMVNKYTKPHRVSKPFAIMSKGLGSYYADINGDYHRACLDSSFTTSTNKKQNLPRYLTQKIFNEEQKKALKLKNDYIRKLKEPDIINESLEIKKSRNLALRENAKKQSKSDIC